MIVTPKVGGAAAVIVREAGQPWVGGVAVTPSARRGPAKEPMVAEARLCADSSTKVPAHLQPGKEMGGGEPVTG